MGKFIKRTDIVAYIDITPNSSPTWKIVGDGMTTGSYTYEANEESETYIIHDNATTIVQGYTVSLDGEMKCIKGDDVYDYINGLRYNLAVGDDAATHILLIDKYDEVSTDNFKSQKFDCAISISSYGGDGGATPTIGFKVSLNGDPVNGTSTITSGTPTFSPSGSV